MNFTLSIRDYFISNVSKKGGCWLWEGRTSTSGYGVLSIKGQEVYAHRWAFEFYKNQSPKDKLVCHKCDIKTCVNPRHLFLGDHKINALDAHKKGRLRCADGSILKYGFCKRGHKLNEKNSYYRPSGRRSRMCRKCIKAREERRFKK